MRMATAAPPMMMMPLRIVRRSEKSAKRRGIQESTAMLAMTLGASMKPAWAATKSRAPSERMVTKAMVLPVPPHEPYSASASVALRVLPAWGAMPESHSLACVT